MYVYTIFFLGISKLGHLLPWHPVHADNLYNKKLDHCEITFDGISKENFIDKKKMLFQCFWYASFFIILFVRYVSFSFFFSLEWEDYSIDISSMNFSGGPRRIGGRWKSRRAYDAQATGSISILIVTLIVFLV